MSVRLRNLTAIVQSITVVRPTQTYSKNADPLEYILLTDEEYSLISPPLADGVWSVEFNPPDISFTPVPVLPEVVTTDDLDEGSLHLYFTEERARAAFREGLAVASLSILESGVAPVFHTIIQGGDQSAEIVYTLPAAQGTSGTFLRNNGAGVLSWTTTPSPTVSLQDAYFQSNLLITSATYGSVIFSGSEAVRVTSTQGLSAITFSILEGGPSPTFYSTFQGSNQSNNILYKLPPSQGVSASILTNDGAGNLSWEVPSTVDFSVQNSVLDCGAANVGAFADGTGTIGLGGRTVESFLNTLDTNLENFKVLVNTPAGANYVGFNGTGTNFLTGDTLVQQALLTLDTQLAAVTPGSTTLQQAYVASNLITTTLAKGNVTIAGTEALKITAIKGLDTSFIHTSSVNQGISIVPNGTGFLAAAVPDNTPVGGSVRGLNSVDFQTSRAASAQVASGNNAVISGGSNNKASNNNTTIAGGTGNTASGDSSTISGGSASTASGSLATVGGGNGHTASGDRSTIGGGNQNMAWHDATVGGGTNNSASESRSTVSGGQNNIASEVGSTVAGGIGNTASQPTATVLGGYGNTAAHDKSMAGGAGALTSANYDLVLGQVTSLSSSASNVHFRMAGDSADLHIGRSVNQAIVAGANNELRLHTVNPFEQSQYIGHRSSTTLTTSTSYVWTNDGASGQVLRTDGAGNLTWVNMSTSSMTIGGTIAGVTGGSILFANGTLLGQDNSNLFWDNSTKRLGLGTVTPQATLSVGVGSPFQINSAGNFIKINNIPTSFPSVQGGPGTILSNDGSGGLSWVASAASQWLSSGSDIYFSAGKVGIGTSTPVSALSVGAGSAFQVNGAGNILSIRGVTYSFPVSQATGTQFLQNDGAGNLSWATGGGSSTLQAAYDGGNTITTTSPNAVTIAGGEGINILSTRGSYVQSSSSAENTLNIIGDNNNINATLRIRNSNALNMLELADNGNNYVQFFLPAGLISYPLTLPNAQGAANTFLRNNGSGVLTWATSTSSTSLQDAYINGNVINSNGFGLPVSITGPYGLEVDTTAGSGFKGMSIKNSGTNAFAPTLRLWNDASQVDACALEIVVRDGTNSIRIKAPAPSDIVGTYYLTLPTSVGTAGQVLTTDGSFGALSWTSVGGSSSLQGAYSGGNTIDTSLGASPVVIGGDKSLRIDTSSGIVINNTTSATQAGITVSANPYSNMLIRVPGNGCFIVENDALAGSARNNNAVDLQLRRTVANQVASGNGSGLLAGYENKATGAYSVVIGGNANTAGGNQSAILSGVANVTSADECVVGGYSCTAGHQASTAFGWGAITSATRDFVLGNSNAVGSSSTSLVHFRVDGDTSDVHVGRSVDQALFGTSSNILKLHTTNASNQSKYVGHKASASLASSAIYSWGNDGTSGQVLSTDGGGNLSWMTPSSGGNPLTSDLDVATFKVYTTVSNGRLIIEPNGMGALQADSSGDSRGNRAVDFQRFRNSSSNVASADYSFIGNGQDNIVAGIYGVIVGGTNNAISGGTSGILAGSKNAVGGSESATAAGNNNTISQSQGFIGAGSFNVIGASADLAFIGSGYKNQANGSEAAVVSGENNTASGLSSFIASGRNNTASGNYSSVLGKYNTAVHNISTAVGGGATTSADLDFVIGNDDGGSSSLDNVHFRMAGDTSDLHIGRSTDQAAVVGATNKLWFHTTNASNQSFAVTLSAPSLTASVPLTFPNSTGSSGQVLATDGAGILSWVTTSVGAAGGGDQVQYNNSGVFAGSPNFLWHDASSNFIAGGASNSVSNATNNTAIVAGTSNTITSSGTDNGFIGGGSGNTLYGGAPNVAIIGGNTNSVNAINAFVAGGHDNHAASDNSAIVGGFQNFSNDHQTAIIGGNNNSISSAANAVIIGGISNQISTAAPVSVIAGGNNNTITASNSAIVGGDGHSIIVNGAAAFIGGGESHTITGRWGSIIGGLNNRVDNSFSTSLGVGAQDSASCDFIIANNTSASSANVNNNHFRIAGDASDIHVGRQTNQAAVAGANNELRLHTINASNQSNYIGHKASDTLSSTTSYKWSSDGSSGQVLSTDGAGHLSWVTPASELVADVTLTPSDLANISTTSITAIAAVAGQAHVVTSIEAFLDYNTTTYTGGNSIFVQYGGFSAGLQSPGFILAAFVKNTSAIRGHIEVGSTQISTSTQLPINAAIIIAGINNFATGDSNLKIRLRYKTITPIP